MKVSLKRFHLNGHAIEFRPQTQKLEQPYKTIIHSGSEGANTYHQCPKSNTLNVMKIRVNCLYSHLFFTCFTVEEILSGCVTDPDYISVLDSFSLVLAVAPVNLK